MALPRNWQKGGTVTSFVSTPQGVKVVQVPVQTWLQKAGVTATRPAQASQSGPTGSATAVGPTGDGVPVSSGARLHCSFGMAFGVLMVAAGGRAANINDGRGGVNIVPFGMCRSMSNPAVAAATAAAMGIVTPMPCVPATQRWSGGSSTEQSGGAPALHPGSTLMCAFGGQITVVTSS